LTLSEEKKQYIFKVKFLEKTIYTKYLIFINPLSSVAKKRKFHLIENFFKSRSLYCKTFFSEYAGHMPLLVKETLQKEYSQTEKITVIAVGGDGTLKEVCQGVIDFGNANIYIGYIPSGTANIMAKELGISGSIESMCQIILQCKKISNIKMAIADNIYFLFTLGIGFDGITVKKVNLRLKKMIGGGAYIVSALKALFHCRNSEQFRIIIDGKGFTARSVVINRAERYAADLKVFRGTKLSSNEFNILILKKVNILILLTIIFKSLLRQHNLHEKNFFFVKGKEIMLKSCYEISCQIDGDTLPFTPKKITLSSKSVNIITP